MQLEKASNISLLKCLSSARKFACDMVPNVYLFLVTLHVWSCSLVQAWNSNMSKNSLSRNVWFEHLIGFKTPWDVACAYLYKKGMLFGLNKAPPSLFFLFLLSTSQEDLKYISLFHCVHISCDTLRVQNLFCLPKYSCIVNPANNMFLYHVWYWLW